MNKRKGILVVFSGFAGSGKGTIMKELMNRYPENYALSISATTRNPRPGEEDGREYFFKTVEEFQELINKGEMLEYAQYVNNYYGTPKAYVESKLQEGYDVILEIETQGALKVKEMLPDTLLMFVTPPDAETLFRRLTGRGTEDEETIAKRMAQAAHESTLIPQYDYLVVNDELEACVNQVHSIIENEHCKTKHNKDNIDQLKDQLAFYSK
ncbi:MAG: guanylate kinase [Lachnospiraceae bacterium]|nr:guanylate kinase [Lachnospiraceae bacterium]